MQGTRLFSIATNAHRICRRGTLPRMLRISSFGLGILSSNARSASLGYRGSFLDIGRTCLPSCHYAARQMAAAASALHRYLGQLDYSWNRIKAPNLALDRRYRRHHLRCFHPPLLRLIAIGSSPMSQQIAAGPFQRPTFEVSYFLTFIYLIYNYKISK